MMFRRRILSITTRRPVSKSCSVSVKNDSKATVLMQSLLGTWPGDYRLVLNKLVRSIMDNNMYKEKAKEHYIDATSWRKYVFSMRRRVVKDPNVIFHNDAETFIQFCRLMDKGYNIKNPKLAVQSFEGDNATMHGNQNESEFQQQAEELLYQLVFKNARKELRDVMLTNEALQSISDLRLPHEWYAYPRLMKRKIIFHGGPTNSGKTHFALKRLLEADPARGGGLYCGPLRLLALEVYERLNKEGVYTTLLTGQERKEVPSATHVSCTVEMVNVNRDYDVAVIDEIQMICDPARGSSWTRALQGLRAREVHVCGGLEASTLVQSLAESCGDEFELINYSRLSELKISDTSLNGDYSKVQPGDCIVAFSRADIFSIRRQVERLTPYKCAVIYGQLPSETRSTQARLFNETNTGYDVLVASDAIGMGLNLNIKRVIMHTVLKRHGSQAYWVDASSVKQICGRAGRKSSQYKYGEVTAWQEADLAYIKAIFSWDIPQIPSAGIFPSVELVQLFCEKLKAFEMNHEKAPPEEEDGGSVPVDTDDMDNASESSVSANVAISSGSKDNIADSVYRGKSGIDTKTRLSTLLSRFVDLSQMDGRYFLCEHEHLVMISNWLHSIPLSLADRFVFANAPVSIRDPKSLTTLYQFAATYALGRPVALNVRLNRKPPKDVMELSALCMKHNVLDLYQWLSLRFPKYFVEYDICLEQKNFAISMIEQSLEKMLDHRHSHSSDYQRLRRHMISESGEHVLPLAEPFRQTMRELLEKIPMAERYVFPYQEHELGEFEDVPLPHSKSRVSSFKSAARGRPQREMDSAAAQDTKNIYGPLLAAIRPTRDESEKKGLSTIDDANNNSKKRVWSSARKMIS